MYSRYLRGVLACCVLALVSCDDTKRESAGTKPFVIRLVDNNTNKPLSEFRYQYYCKTTKVGREREEVEWKTRKSDDGSVTIEIPEACQLEFEVIAHGYVAGYYNVHHTIDVRSDRVDRSETIRLDPGITVEGIVRDVVTKEPISAATAYPVVYGPPPDFGGAKYDYLSTKSDEKGRFHLTGVCHGLGGIEVTHPDYLQSDNAYLPSRELREDPKPVIQHDVLMRRGEEVRGQITHNDGKPIEGVEILAYHEKAAATNKNGEFRYVGFAGYGNDKQHHRVQFRKDGYLTKELTARADKGGWTIKLEPAFAIRGRVLAADGKAVTSYTVWTGPGANPTEYRCSKASVSNSTEAFQITSQVAGKHWLAVRADGYATSEGTIDVQRQMNDTRITLKPGVRVSGKVTRPTQCKAELRASLTPQRAKPEESWGSDAAIREFGALDVAIAADGSFSFENVAPDRYVLFINGAQASPHREAVVVKDQPIDLATIVLAGTGRIVGQAWYPNESYRAFEEGELSTRQNNGCENRHSFRTDQNGRFEIDDVPAGEVSVLLHHQLHDLVFSDAVNALVNAGETTEVKFCEPNTKKKFRVEIEAEESSGKMDRSKRDELFTHKGQFHVLLKRMSQTPGAYSLSRYGGNYDEGRVELTDVAAGRYQVTLCDTFEYGVVRGPLFVGEADVDSRNREIKVRVQQGILRGQIESAKTRRYGTEVIAVRSQDKTLRTTRWDEQGQFALRFLAPGEWRRQSAAAANWAGAIGARSQ